MNNNHTIMYTHSPPSSPTSELAALHNRIQRLKRQSTTPLPQPPPYPHPPYQHPPYHHPPPSHVNLQLQAALARKRRLRAQIEYLLTTSHEEALDEQHNHAQRVLAAALDSLPPPQQQQQQQQPLPPPPQQHHFFPHPLTPHHPHPHQVPTPQPPAHLRSLLDKFTVDDEDEEDAWSDVDVSNLAVPDRKQRRMTITAAATKTPNSDARDALFTRLMRMEAGMFSRPKGLSLWRAAVIGIIFFIRLRHMVTRRLDDRKRTDIKDFVERLGLCSALLRKWMKAAAKNAVASILYDPSVDLSVDPRGRGGLFRRSLKQKDLDARVLMIRVRVRQVFSTLHDILPLPPAVCSFVRRFMIDSGRFFPCADPNQVPADLVGQMIVDGEYLLPSEATRIAFDAKGATSSLTPAVQRLLLVNFVCTRVLLGMVLRPWDNRIVSNKVPRSKTQKNLRILGTVIYWTIRAALRRIMQSPSPDDERIVAQLLDKDHWPPLEAATKDTVLECRALLLSWVEKAMQQLQLTQ